MLSYSRLLLGLTKIASFAPKKGVVHAGASGMSA